MIPASYNGMPIHTNRFIPMYRPKVRLSSKVDVSAKFILEFNQWSMKWLGKEPLVLETADGFIMHPAILEQFKLQLIKNPGILKIGPQL